MYRTRNLTLQTRHLSQYIRVVLQVVAYWPYNTSVCTLRASSLLHDTSIINTSRRALTPPVYGWWTVTISAGGGWGRLYGDARAGGRRGRRNDDGSNCQPVNDTCGGTCLNQSQPSRHAPGCPRGRTDDLGFVPPHYKSIIYVCWIRSSGYVAIVDTVITKLPANQRRPLIEVQVIF